MSYVSTTLLVDRMRDAVRRCEFADDFFEVGESLHFDHGHMVEIAGKLTKENQYKQKYPLVILVEDIDQEMYSEMNHLNLRLFIVAINSNKTMMAPERYEISIKPKLDPIYGELIKQISSQGFSWDRNKYGDFPPHIAAVRTRFGVWLQDKGTVANIFNDPLDAIEIRDLKVNIKSKKC